MPAIQQESPGYLLSCPPEILHRIFSFMSDAKQIGHARRSCSLLATIGAEHLIKEARLVFGVKGFGKLLRIATHRLISKSVRSVHYQADRFSHYNSLLDWLISNDVSLGFQQFQLPDDDPKAARLGLYDREEPWVPYPTSDRYREVRSLSQSEKADENLDINKLSDKDQRLIRHYRVYKAYREEQAQIQNELIDMGSLKGLFYLCPNIHSFSLAMRSEGADSNKLLTAHFGPVNHPCGDRDIKIAEHGKRHIFAICIALLSAKRSLKCFAVSGIAYKFLNLPNDEFELIQKALTGLRAFRLDFVAIDVRSDEEIEDDDWVEDDTDFNARQTFESGRLRELVTAMPNLHTLKIKIPYPGLGPDHAFEVAFKDVIGDHVWPALRDFGISLIISTEDELVDFFLKHAARLRRFTLTDMLLEQGTWAGLLKRISCQFPRLRSISLCGTFMSMEREPFMAWDDFSKTSARDLGRRRQLNPMRQALELYVLNGGEFPKLDLPARFTDADDEFEEASSEDEEVDYDSDGSYVFEGYDEWDRAVLG